MLVVTPTSTLALLRSSTSVKGVADWVPKPPSAAVLKTVDEVSVFRSKRSDKR